MCSLVSVIPHIYRTQFYFIYLFARNYYGNMKGTRHTEFKLNLL